VVIGDQLKIGKSEFALETYHFGRRIAVRPVQDNQPGDSFSFGFTENFYGIVAVYNFYHLFVPVGVAESQRFIVEGFALSAPAVKS
jgi:hypothetical protein